MSDFDSSANYENGVLKSTPPNIKKLQIDPKAVSIFGKDSSEYAFNGCASTIEEVTFGKNPIISSIQPFAFYSCICLKTIDFSSCTKLKSIGESAFNGCINAKSLKLPPNVATIGKKAFYKCEHISSVDIPDSVSSIGQEIFHSCYRVKSITIRDSSVLETLPSRCFQATGIVNMYIPKNILSISMNSFEDTVDFVNYSISSENKYFSVLDGVLFNKNQSYLQHFPPKHSLSYTLPDTVRILGSVSFCKSHIETIDLGTKLIKINDYVFQFSNLKSISIPDTVTFTGTSLCYHCIYLKSVKLSNRCGAIGSLSFSFTGITFIDVPECVTYIGAEAFRGCTKLSKITLPSNLKDFGGGVFNGIDNIEIKFGPNSKFFIDDNLFLMNTIKTELYGYLGTNKIITIPNTITYIGQSSFNEHENIEHVKFAENSNLTTIGKYSFKNCPNLAIFEMPDTVESIYNFAFQSCNKLESISFPRTIKYIGEEAFSWCCILKDVKFQELNPGVILDIHKKSFYNCTSLANIAFPEGLSKIYDKAFMECTSLSTVTFPKTIESIGLDAFYNSGICTATFSEPSTITEIQGSAFKKATKLKNINIPSSCTTLGSFTFAYTALERIEIPESVKSIGSRCFSNCYSLKEFIVPSKEAQLMSLGDFIFEKCRNLLIIDCNNSHFIDESNVLLSKNRESIIIYPPASKIKFYSVPSTIKRIAPCAFYECNNLCCIQIQDDSVITLSFSSFEGCKNLQSINIPLCVKVIGDNVFKDCNNLNCGLYIESNDIDFRNTLVKKGKLPQKCLIKCYIGGTCARSNSIISSNLLYIITLVFS